MTGTKLERCVFGFAAFSDEGGRQRPVLIDHVCVTGRLAGKLIVLLPGWAGKSCAELIDSTAFNPSREAARDFAWDGGWDWTGTDWNWSAGSGPIWEGDSARCLNFWSEDADANINSPTNILSDARALRSHRHLGWSSSGLTESEIDEAAISSEFQGKVLNTVKVSDRELHIGFTDGTGFTLFDVMNSNLRIGVFLQSKTE